MERENFIKPLEARVKMLPREIKAELDELRMQTEFDAKALAKAALQIEALEYEIQTIQGNAKDLVRKAQNYASHSTKQTVVRLYKSRLDILTEENTKLARVIAKLGDEVACPDCGVVHKVKDLLMVDTE